MKVHPDADGIVLQSRDPDLRSRKVTFGIGGLGFTAFATTLVVLVLRAPPEEIQFAAVFGVSMALILVGLFDFLALMVVRAEDPRLHNNGIRMRCKAGSVLRASALIPFSAIQGVEMTRRQGYVLLRIMLEDSREVFTRFYEDPQRLRAVLEGLSATEGFRFDEKGVP